MQIVLASSLLRRAHLRPIFALLFATGLTGSGTADAKADPALAGSELKFHRVADKWVATVDLSIPKDAAADTENRIRLSDSSIKLETKPEPGNKPQTLRIVHLTLTADGPIPPDLKYRYLIVGDTALAITTAKAPATAGWALQKVGPIALETGSQIPLVVTTTDRPIASLTIVPNTLFEKDSEHPLGTAGLTLVDPDAKDQQAGKVDVPAFATKRLAIEGADRSGHYTGTVTLSADDGTSVTASDAVIDLSTACEKLVGFLLMALGVVFSTVGASLFRGFYGRETALLQAARALARIEIISTEIRTKCGANPTPAIDLMLQQLTAALDKNSLKTNGLPKILSWPYERNDPEPAQLYLFLNGVIGQISAIEAIVREGLEVVAKQMNGAAAPQLAVLQQTFSQMDAIASQLTSSTTHEAVEDKLNQLLQPPPPPHANLFDGVLETDAVSFVPSAEDLERKITILSAAGWFVVVALTLFSGAYAFFLSSAGNSFSIASGWALCLLWGFGLPSGVQALTATISGLLSSLGLNRPAT